MRNKIVAVVAVVAVIAAVVVFADAAVAVVADAALIPLLCGCELRKHNSPFLRLIPSCFLQAQHSNNSKNSNNNISNSNNNPIAAATAPNSRKCRRSESRTIHSLLSAIGSAL